MDRLRLYWPLNGDSTPASLWLDRDLRQRRLDRNRKLDGLRSRERARPPRCVEQIPCHPLFKDQNPHFARLPAADHCRLMSVAFHAAPLASARLPERARYGVLFRPNGWGAEPLASVTELEPKEPPKSARFDTCSIESGSAGPSLKRPDFRAPKTLPSPGGQSRSRGRDGIQPARQRSRHHFARRGFAAKS